MHYYPSYTHWADWPIAIRLVPSVGHPRYPSSPGTPAAVAELFATLRTLGGHVFWPDDISLFDTARVRTARLLDAVQITGTYLLALASAHGGQLATFDRHLVTDTVIGEAHALHLIS
jgi:hypothetical protein